MYRTTRRLHRWSPQMLLKKASPSPQIVRNLSGVKVGMSRSVQVAASSTALTVSLVGTTLVVAKQNEEFRVFLEGLPGASNLLDAIIGEKVKTSGGVRMSLTADTANEAGAHQKDGLDLVVKKIRGVEPDEGKVGEDVVYSEAEPEAVPAADSSEMAKLEDVLLKETTAIECDQPAIETKICDTESEVLLDKTEESPPEVNDNLTAKNDSAADVLIEHTKVETSKVKVEKIITEVKIKKEAVNDEFVTEAKTDELLTESPTNEIVTKASTNEVVTEAQTDELLIKAPMDELVAGAPTDKVVTEKIATEAPLHEVFTKAPINDIISAAPIDESIIDVKVEKEAKTNELKNTSMTKDSPNDLVIKEEVSTPVTIPEQLSGVKMALKDTSKIEVKNTVDEGEIPQTSSETEKAYAIVSSIEEAGVTVATVLVTATDMATDIILPASQEKEVSELPLEPSDPPTKAEIISDPPIEIVKEYDPVLEGITELPIKTEIQSVNDAHTVSEAVLEQIQDPVMSEKVFSDTVENVEEEVIEIEKKNDKLDKHDYVSRLVIRSVPSKEEDIESNIPTFAGVVEKFTNPDVQLSLMNGASDDTHAKDIKGTSDSEEATIGEGDEQIKHNEAKNIEEAVPPVISDTVEEVTMKDIKDTSSIATEAIDDEPNVEVKKESVQEVMQPLVSETVEEEPMEEVKKTDEEVPLVSAETIHEESSKDVKNESSEILTLVAAETDQQIHSNDVNNSMKTIDDPSVATTDAETLSTVTEDIVEEKPLEESSREEPVSIDDGIKADKPLEELAVEELVAVVQDTTQELDKLQETLIEEMEKTAGLAMKVLRLQEDIVKQQKIDREKYSKELEIQKQQMLEDIKVKTEELLIQKESIENKYVVELEGMNSTYEEILVKKEEEYQTKFLEKGDEYQTNLEEQRNELENVMIKHIARQAAAHHEHLEEQLQLQEKEHVRRHSSVLTSSLVSAHTDYETRLASLRGRLDGLEAGLTERGNADAEVLVAQQLWLACRDLVDAVSGGEGKLPAWEQGVCTVGQYIQTVQTVKEGDEFISAVLSSLPEAVHDRGVYSEAALKFRFNRVEKAASRVALVGEHGGTPLQHLLSLITSMLMVNTVDSHEADYVCGERSQMELIWRARYCVNNGDMGMAVQYMNQLRGDAALVARDWVKESRMLLETQLAASALMSYATSIAIEVLPPPE